MVLMTTNSDKISDEQSDNILDLLSLGAFSPDTQLARYISHWSEFYRERTVLHSDYSEHFTATAQDTQLKSIISGSKRVLKNLSECHEVTRHHLEHGRKIAQIDQEMGSSEFNLSLSTLEKELQFLIHGAEFLRTRMPEKKGRSAGLPALDDLIAMQIRPFWRLNNIGRKFFEKFTEFDFEPRNECSKFTVGVVKIIDPEIAPKNVEKAMRKARKAPCHALEICLET